MPKRVRLELPGGGGVVLIPSRDVISADCGAFGCRLSAEFGVDWGEGYEREDLYLCRGHLTAGLEQLQNALLRSTVPTP